MRIISTKAPLVDKRRSCMQKLRDWNMILTGFDNSYFRHSILTRNFILPLFIISYCSRILSNRLFINIFYKKLYKICINLLSDSLLIRGYDVWDALFVITNHIILRHLHNSVRHVKLFKFVNIVLPTNTRPINFGSPVNVALQWFLNL